MGQFDLETDAAIAQLNFEEISKTPGGEFAEIIGDLLALVGSSGPLALAGKASNLMLKIRRLAGASYGDNLIYTINAVRNDLADLYAKHAELRVRIESLQDDPKFAEAIAALALRAMHTSVKERLKRLARIVVNGVKEDDLEPEILDDMMRAAAELKDVDIVLLGKIYESQKSLLKQRALSPTNWFSQIQSYWNEFVSSGALDASKHLVYRSSFSRLESHGLIQKFREISTASVGLEHYALLEEGMRFYERLQEIGTVK
jgi:hypothetical protein